jgi:hypothetical protein
MEVDSYYFEQIVGREPKSEIELADFAHSIKKGIDWSVDWEEINNNAKDSL